MRNDLVGLTSDEALDNHTMYGMWAGHANTFIEYRVMKISPLAMIPTIRSDGVSFGGQRRAREPYH